MNRRTFLKSSVAGAIALAGAPAFVRAQDKTSTCTTALIGCGWWGGNILGAALAAGQSKLVALCDVDQRQIAKLTASLSGKTSDSPKQYTDYREMLAKEKPQIVIVATPDHWHALTTIEAVKSGAHVYVEKPISHTVLEGLAMVKAARAADRVVQVGTHRRVAPHNISAREFVQAGKCGKVGMIRTFVYSGGGAETPRANTEPPKGLDWDFWCGPAPLRKFNEKIHPRGFRQFLDFANGQLGDWGIHWIDQALWFMNAEHPKTVFSTGGRPVRGAPINDEHGQTSDSPDHQVVAYTFDDFTLTWEHRMFAGDGAEKGEPVGAMFYGTKGTLHVGWQRGWTFYPTDGGQTEHQEAHFSGEENSDNIPELWTDFLDAIKNHRKPVCDIEIGHRATTAALLGMISLTLGRSVKWDGQKQTIPDDPQAAELLKRPYRGPWAYPQA
jgi:predicted dehydrogenase